MSNSRPQWNSIFAGGPLIPTFAKALAATGGEYQNRTTTLQFRLLPHDHLGPHRHAIVEVGHVGIDQPETAGRYLGPDRIRPVGAVDAVDGGAEIHGARAEWITGSARHEAWQIRLALDHLRWRHPVGPFRLARDVE